MFFTVFLHAWACSNVRLFSCFDSVWGAMGYWGLECFVQQEATSFFSTPWQRLRWGHVGWAVRPSAPTRVPGYYKQCCDEHWGTRVSFSSGFLSVYAQQWDCWVIWQFCFQYNHSFNHPNLKLLQSDLSLSIIPGISFQWLNLVCLHRVS